MKYYLAYGSNLDTTSFYKRCPNAKLVTTATMQGYKLSFKRLNELSNTYLTIEKDESSEIPIAIYKISTEDEKALDYYESIHTNLYYKVETELLLHNQRVLTLTYIMNDSSIYGLPSDDYYKLVRKGYMEHDFDIKYLEEALQRSKKWVNKND